MNKTDPNPELNAASRSGYCIFVDCVCGGMTPVWRDEAEKWVVYETQEAAEMEIEDDEREMLRQYLAGERALEHGVESEDIICKVTQLPDGSVVDEWGRVFGI